MKIDDGFNCFGVRFEKKFKVFGVYILFSFFWLYRVWWDVVGVYNFFFFCKGWEIEVV